MKVLILSITAGEGHNSTAAAIKDCFAAHGDTAEVFDAYRYVSKALYEIVKQGYLLVSKDFKALFAKSYAMAENRRAGGQNGNSFYRVANMQLTKKLSKYIKQYAPDAIIYTHPFLGVVTDLMKTRNDIQIPMIGVVTKIRVDTPDVKTFRVVGLDGKKPFEHIPGQCAMLSIPGVGEALFSITSSPTEEAFVEFSIKKCGCVTNWLHDMEPGQEITIRGPYGNGFPVDTAFAGKDLLFIAGGIGLAPLHSVINYCRYYRSRYGKIDIVYGSRSMEDLVDYPEIENVWCKEDGINVHLTIDREQPEWSGHVGFVPNYVKELGFTTDKTVVMCGPPIMIKFTLAGLMELGFAREQVYTTMELKMKCALGKCGRCNIGNKYVCKDGPVFRFDQLDELPDEY